MVEVQEREKLYRKKVRHNVISLRLTPIQAEMLERDMSREGYENRTYYITSKLFGTERQQKERLAKDIKDRNLDEIAGVLQRSMLDIAMKTDYATYAFDSRTRLLRQKKDFDQHKWEKVIRHYYQNMIAIYLNGFKIVRFMANKLGARAYFKMPSDKMNFDPENCSQEELTKYMRQVQLEEYLGEEED